MPRPLSATPVSAPATLTEAAILWTECLHGAGDLRAAITSLSRCARAESAVLIRANAETGKHRILSSYDCKAAVGAFPLTQPLGLDLITIPAHRARAGSLWFLHDPSRAEADRLEPEQQRWLAQRAIADVVLVVLGQNAGSVDLLEFHLTRRLDRRDQDQLEGLAQAIAFAWNRRPAGRIARLMTNAPAVTRRLDMDQAPVSTALSSANPWQLTATELRICNLIRDGLAATDIVSAFGIAESTVRSHLRNIYAKAGVTGQVGLVHKLLDGPSAKAAMH
jgi:DNA-binding CsgD family transcriptional regulator